MIFVCRGKANLSEKVFPSFSHSLLSENEASESRIGPTLIWSHNILILINEEKMKENLHFLLSFLIRIELEEEFKLREHR